MKTIRTILATLAGVLVVYGLVAVISVNQEAAFVERSIFQLFSMSYFVALVLGVAFLLVAILLTIAVVSFKDKPEDDILSDEYLDDEDDEEEEDDEDIIIPAPRRATRDFAPIREAEAYTRRMPVVRQKPTAEFSRAENAEAEPAFLRETPKTEKQAAFCSNCGEALEAAVQYCPACGKKVMRVEA
jgi:hypothetical protein